MYLINKEELEFLDPNEFGLGSRTLMVRKKDGLVVLLKDRKSRIIMNDGKKILDQIKQIKKLDGRGVGFATNAPICSKTTKFFKDNNIEIYSLEKQNV